MKKAPIFRFLSIPFVVCFSASTLVGDVESPLSEIEQSSPLKKEALEARRAWGFSYFFEDEDEEGTIVNLEPLVISPIVTTTDQLIEDIRRDPDQFLTGKGWRENMGYRSAIDEYLNLFSLPFFGLPQEAIAFMYAEDAKFEKKLETFELIMNARKLYRKSSTDVYMQDRYDLMRMKRNALFGSSWAIPEWGI